MGNGVVWVTQDDAVLSETVRDNLMELFPGVEIRMFEDAAQLLAADGAPGVIILDLAAVLALSQLWDEDRILRLVPAAHPGAQCFAYSAMGLEYADGVVADIWGEGSGVVAVGFSARRAWAPAIADALGLPKPVVTG